MFRFTIRDVLWLTVVVGLALGWWNEWSQSRAVSSEANFLRQAIENSGFVPSGTYVGPILLRKQPAEPNP